MSGAPRPTIGRLTDDGAASEGPTAFSPAAGPRSPTAIGARPIPTPTGPGDLPTNISRTCQGHAKRAGAQTCRSFTGTNVHRPRERIQAVTGFGGAFQTVHFFSAAALAVNVDHRQVPVVEITLEWPDLFPHAIRRPPGFLNRQLTAAARERCRISLLGCGCRRRASRITGGGAATLRTAVYEARLYTLCSP